MLLLRNNTTEALISKLGKGVLYSIRMKMGIFKSVLIKAIIKKNFFLYKLCILKICFVINPFQTDTGFIDERFHINGKDACTNGKRAFPLPLAPHESHHASFHNLLNLLRLWDSLRK